jgi:hypothetical protein
MKKLILILITSLLVFSCQEKQLMQKPANFISESEMTAILVDYYLAKGYNDIEKKHKRVQKSEDEAISPSAYIYKKYQIDSLQFAQNMNYYLGQEEVVLAIFTAAEKQLKEKESLYKGKKLERDSLQKIKNEAKKKNVKLIDKIKPAFSNKKQKKLSPIELEKEHQLRTEKPKANKLSNKP